jgi:hypothetical protein
MQLCSAKPVGEINGEDEIKRKKDGIRGKKDGIRGGKFEIKGKKDEIKGIEDGRKIKISANLLNIFSPRIRPKDERKDHYSIDS